MSAAMTFMLVTLAGGPALGGGAGPGASGTGTAVEEGDAGTGRPGVREEYDHQGRVVSRHPLPGRPADLDPRIPWVPELGAARSGGPDPYVPVARFTLPEPPAGHFNCFTLLKSGKVALGSRKVYVVDGGKLLRTIDLPALPKVDTHAYCANLFRSGGGFIALVRFLGRREMVVAEYDDAGNQQRVWAWTFRNAPGEVEFGWTWFVRGHLLMDLNIRTRNALAIDPEPGVGPEDVVSPSDLRVEGDPADPRVAVVRTRHVSLGHPGGRPPTPEEAREDEEIRAAENRRAARARGWDGRRLDWSTLPCWTPDPLHVQPSLGYWAHVVAVLHPSSLVIEDVITLPRAPGFRRYEGPTRERPLLVWYDPAGRVQRYLVIPPTFTSYSIEADRVCVIQDKAQVTVWGPR